MAKYVGAVVLVYILAVCAALAVFFEYLIFTDDFSEIHNKIIPAKRADIPVMSSSALPAISEVTQNTQPKLNGRALDLFPDTEANIDAQTNNICTAMTCPVGTMVMTIKDFSDPFFACETVEMTYYMNWVLGEVATTHALTVALPDASPATGEPIINDVRKPFIEKLRRAARVKSVDEALDRCVEGSYLYGKKLTVLKMSSDLEYASVVGDNYGPVWISLLNLQKKS